MRPFFISSSVPIVSVLVKSSYLRRLYPIKLAIYYERILRVGKLIYLTIE